MTILDKIVARKREELNTWDRGYESHLRAAAGDADRPRGFLDALKAKAKASGRPALIAEIKKASPSRGIIREDFDPPLIARQYAAGGASCLSVLTDRDFFQGDLEFLRQARETTTLPALRKDFLIDPRQITEARAAGADAVLLIAAILSPGQLAELHGLATEMRMDALVEIHDQQDWEVVLESGANPSLVGINNRDLRTFEVNLETTESLAPQVKDSGALVVAESGIFTRDDIQRVWNAGAQAILVGESLMRQPDPAEAARKLLEIDNA